MSEINDFCRKAKVSNGPLIAGSCQLGFPFCHRRGHWSFSRSSASCCGSVDPDAVEQHGDLSGRPRLWPSSCRSASTNRRSQALYLRLRCSELRIKIVLRADRSGPCFSRICAERPELGLPHCWYLLDHALLRFTDELARASSSSAVRSTTPCLYAFNTLRAIVSARFLSRSVSQVCSPS